MSQPITPSDAPTVDSAAALHDEMVDGNRRLRPHWRAFLGAIAPLEPVRMAERWEEARRLLRQNGVTYNIYGDPQGIERPWPLDLIPLLIPGEEWQALAAGIVQRARLLNAILGDLYGPQTLIRQGRMPASLLHADPNFRRACHGLRAPGNVFLHYCAVDLARAPDGRWWVLGDRTETPSGVGYALENRAVLSRVLPDGMRACKVETLAPFLDRVRDTLAALAPNRTRPRIVLLTPGPYNETYFEHAYLARHLGIALVEGADLSVRDRRVFLKTLSGLEPVDVILRRLADDFCDPLELRTDSALGVAGLLQAVRAGTVVVANAIGSGLMESMSFKAFLPTFCRHLLGEELLLPDVASWWCGQDAEGDYVIEHLRELVIKPAHRGQGMEPIFGAALSKTQLRELTERIRRTPWNFVGQERIDLSNAPVWTGEGLEPRPLVLRVFVAANGDGDYTAMPGGLTRVSTDRDRLVVSMQSGGGSKDTWVLKPALETGDRQPSETEEATRPAGRSPDRRHERRAEPRGIGAELPSRVADGLFWLGRYAERADGVVRVLRGVHARLGESRHPGANAELSALLRLMVWEALLPLDLASAVDAGPNRAVRTALTSAVFDPANPSSLRSNIQRLYRAAHGVRDRLSLDMWRVIDAADKLSLAPERIDGAATLLVLEDIITALAALAGLQQESMTRGAGWRFLDIGRRLERVLHAISLIRGARLTEPTGPRQELKLIAGLDVLLELGESFMAYRERHFATARLGSVLELLLLDRDNPRSVAFQLAALVRHLEQLPVVPGTGEGGGRAAAGRRSASRDPTTAALRLVEDAWEQLSRPELIHSPSDLLAVLVSLAASLPDVSNLLTQAYFSHAFAHSA